MKKAKRLFAPGSIQDSRVGKWPRLMSIDSRRYSDDVSMREALMDT